MRRGFSFFDVFRGSNSIGMLCGSRVCGVERRRWRRKGSGALGSAAEQCKRRKSAQQCDTAQSGRVPERALSPTGRIHAAPNGLHSSRRDTRAKKTAAGSFFLTPSTESAPKMYGEARTPSARYAGKGYAELSAAGGGESEAEHWAVPQSSAVRRKSVRQCDTAQPGRVPARPLSPTGRIDGTFSRWKSSLDGGLFPYFFMDNKK